MWQWNLCSIYAGFGWDVIGIDFDPAAIENARAKGLTVALGDLAQQDYSDNTFDAIIINHVVEHVLNPLDLLHECYRILKPSGKLMVATPNAVCWGHYLYGENWRGLEPPRQLHIFTRSALITFFEKTRFSLESIKTRARAPSLFLASRSLRKNKRPDFISNNVFLIKIWAKGMQKIEAILNLIRKDLGQEIVLLASKEI